MLRICLFLSLLVFLSSAQIERRVSIYMTSLSGDRLARKADVEWQNNFHNPNTIVYNPAKRYQKIFGFGGALTEAAAVNVFFPFFFLKI